HEQNLVLPDGRLENLHALWREAWAAGLGTNNKGLLSDIIACPGGDYCALANAKSIPIAQGIQQRFEDLDHLHDIGELSLNISGCMNACGHHHIGNIGILGVDKNGSEWYQGTLGGAQRAVLALGAAEGDLVPLAAVLVDAEDADVADAVGAAGGHAAGDAQAQLADVVPVVEVL
ncbi:hypothetical protein ACV33M_33170, partial [Pseudomonas aeruginosa]